MDAQSRIRDLEAVEPRMPVLNTSKSRTSVLPAPLLGTLFANRMVVLFHAPSRIAILRAAMKLFASAGHEATTVADIVHEAGLTLDTLYRYFGGKDELARILYGDLLRERDAFIAEPPPDDASLQEQFLFLWKRMVKFAIEYPEAMQFLERYEERFHNDEELEPPDAPRLLIERIDLLTRARIAKEEPPIVLTALVWGALLQLLKLHRRGQCRLSEELVASAAQCCLDAISRSRPRMSPLNSAGRTSILL